MCLGSSGLKASWLLYRPIPLKIGQEYYWPKLALRSSGSWESCGRQAAGVVGVPLHERASSVGLVLALILPVSRGPVGGRERLDVPDADP